jgi:hypothetical protein
VHAATLSALNDYYTDLFGIDEASLWQRATVRTHSRRLQGYEGYYVAWRSDGVHVSTPPSGGSEVTRSLSTETVDTLQNRGFWREFAVERGLQVIGPSTHAYLDRAPGPVGGVTLPQDEGLQLLREAVDESDWAESGWNDQPPHIFGLYEDGLVVAASSRSRVASPMV